MENELWKSVPEYEGLYEASSLGRIRSLDRFEEYYDRGRYCRRHRTGRIILAHQQRGYFKLLLSKHGKVRLWPVHQIVCLTFNGERPDGMQTAHLNGDRADNRPENLKWASSKENMAHQVMHGTRRIGERAPRAKLNVEKVREIREGSAAGATNSELARKFGVWPNAISAVVERRSWAHV